MSNRILSHMVDASTKLILRIRHETKVIVHTNMLAVRQKLWILQGGQRGRAVRGISSWKSVESVVDLAWAIDPRPWSKGSSKRESVNLFNGGCSIFFARNLARKLGPFRLSRNWIWGVSFCPGQNFCRGRISQI